MMSLKTRLDRLQSHYQRRTITAIAAKYGLSVDELLEEAEEFFALPLAEQLARIDAIDAELRREGMSWDNVADIKATLIREYRPI
jgi:hypothetical protein